MGWKNKKNIKKLLNQVIMYLLEDKKFGPVRPVRPRSGFSLSVFKSSTSILIIDFHLYISVPYYPYIL